MNDHFNRIMAAEKGIIVKLECEKDVQDLFKMLPMYTYRKWTECTVDHLHFYTNDSVIIHGDYFIPSPYGSSKIGIPFKKWKLLKLLCLV